MRKTQGELAVGVLEDRGSGTGSRLISTIGPEIALLTVVSLWASTFIVGKAAERTQSAPGQQFKHRRHGLHAIDAVDDGRDLEMGDSLVGEPA
jgi:hypothetical protein